MKGLMIKDLAIMKQRGRILLFMLAWAVAMCFVVGNASFVVGWIVMIATISSTSTISYEEYDNCMPVLLSLPVTRKDYVIGKYLFSLLTALASWVLAVVIVMITSPFSEKMDWMEEVPGMFVFMGVMMLLIAFTIPPQLKWGAEKGRMIFMVIFGVVFFIGFGISRLGVSIEALVTKLNSMSVAGLVAGIILVGAIMLVVSIMISIRIMEKKEF